MVAIFQPIVGVILHHSDSWLVNGVPVYSVASYNRALLVMPCCFLASLIIAIFLLKESHPGRAQKD